MSPPKLHQEQNCLGSETWKSSIWIEVWVVTRGWRWTLVNTAIPQRANGWPCVEHSYSPYIPTLLLLVLLLLLLLLLLHLKDILSPYILTLFSRYWQHKSHFLPTETLLAKWINVHFTSQTRKKILKITNDFKQAIPNKITCSRIEFLSVLYFCSLKMQWSSWWKPVALSHLNGQRW